MTKEDTIIVPRWFLEVVEDTLRIENNINEPDKKETGESCQDRNIRQSLNGIRKLLKGEELTGMERLEKLQPSLPSNLDEASVLSANGAVISRQSSIDGRVVYNLNEKCFNHEDLVRQFKAGAEWMAGQFEKYLVEPEGAWMDRNGNCFTHTLDADDPDQLDAFEPAFYAKVAVEWADQLIKELKQN